MVPFYIIGSLFFIWAILISVYGFKNLSGFKDKSVKSVAAVSAVLFVATVTSAIWGAIVHSADHGEAGHEVSGHPGEKQREQQ